MADRTFAWPTLANKSGNGAYNVLKAQFGDGYAQMMADGINNVTDSWNIEVVCQKGNSGCQAKPNVEAVKLFLDEHGGWKAFNWQPPVGPLAEYVSSAPSIKQISKTLFSISATFTRRRGYDHQ